MEARAAGRVASSTTCESGRVRAFWFKALAASSSLRLPEEDAHY
jgi:hypothetical protein